MKLYKGWLRLEKGETLPVTLHEIKRTGNDKPYAVCVGEQGNTFNVNIAERDATLQKGEYFLHCININNNGYCYVEFEPIPNLEEEHDSWENHDTILQADAYHDDIRIESIKVSMQITKDYAENIEFTNPIIDEAIEKIQSELYQAYGKMLWRHDNR